MAHFINAKGTRISNTIMTAGVGVGVKIAVWGAAGLSVGPNDKSLASIKWMGPDNQNNTWFELTGLRVGYVMVEAKKDTAVWDYFQLAIQVGAGAGASSGGGVAAPPGPNASGLYTSNPHEVKTTKTKTTPADLMALLNTLPGLNDIGRRGLIAQHMHETGGGQSCYNWNLGNTRPSSTNEPHMYLRDVPEYLSPSMGAAALEAGKASGLARSPTAAEKAKWPNRPGLVTVVFEPPSDGARFRAYANLTEGGQRLLSKYRSVGAKNSDFFPALNRGDLATVAHILFLAHYYTGSETAYAARMKEWRAVIDRQLGPTS